MRRVAVCGPGDGKIGGGTAVQALVGSEDAFEETYHRRSIMESMFSLFKCRFTAVVWAKTLPTQRLQPLFRCVCYNILS